MKIVLVFVFILLLIVVGLPFTIKGDGSLTGAVQSFMTYSLSAAGFLLGILTIFLSRSLSDELVNQQIFLIVTKPIARWQFLLGKWVGMTALNLSFLTFVGVATYGMVQYIIHNHPPIDEVFDENELNNQVLVARHVNYAVLPDFTKPAEREYQRNVEDGRYDNVPDFNETAERAKLARKYDARWRVIPPSDVRDFNFTNVLCDRSPDHRVQLRYKTVVAGYPPDEVYRALWVFGDPSKDVKIYRSMVRHAINRYQTISIPADAVAPDHTLRARLYNENPFPGEEKFASVLEVRKPNEVELLFTVGTFHWNMVRLLILIACKLMFLAAVALLMASVFSFPVACLASFTVYTLAGIRSFLEESLGFMTKEYASIFDSFNDFFAQSVMHLYSMIQWVVPDFGHYNAIEDFVNGRNVSLVWVLQGISELVLLKTTVVLALAILLFYRREVADVSV